MFWSLVANQIKNVIVIIVLLSFPTIIPSTGQSMDDGSMAGGLGHAGTALVGDYWAKSNPGVLATSNNRLLSFFTSEAFGISELRYTSAMYVEVLPFGIIAIGLGTFGFEDYRDTQFTLGYANSFGLGSVRKFRAGFRVDINRITIKNYGHGSSTGISAGGLVELLPALHLGFSAGNFNRKDDATEQSLSVGLRYSASDRFLFVIDTIKHINFPVSFRGGLEIRPAKTITFRTGTTTRPTRYTAGVSISVSRFVASIVTEKHWSLGWSQALEFSILL